MKTTNQQLLDAFERLCDRFGVVSAGFNVEEITAPCDGDKHDGLTRWAMKHRRGLGWMVVCGAGGCGSALTGGGEYIKKRSDFLVMMNALTYNVGSAFRRIEAWERESPERSHAGYEGATMKALLVTLDGERREIEIDVEAGAVVQTTNFGAKSRVFSYRTFENKMPVFYEVHVAYTHEFDK